MEEGAMKVNSFVGGISAQGLYPEPTSMVELQLIRLKWALKSSFLVGELLTPSWILDHYDQKTLECKNCQTGVWHSRLKKGVGHTALCPTEILETIILR